MSILIDLGPLIMNICILSEFDQKWTLNCNLVHWIAKQKSQTHVGINKMTECIFNALGFLFLFVFINKKVCKWILVLLFFMRIKCVYWPIVTFVQIMLINMRLSSLVSYLHAQSRSLLLKSICKRKSHACSSFRDVTVKFFIMGNTRYRVPD